MSEADDLPRSEPRARKLRAQQKRDELTRKLVVTTLVTTKDGRRYLWLELSECNVFAQTINFDSFAKTGFLEGQRSRGLKLLADICRWTPDAYILMTRENSQVELEEEQDAPSTSTED